MSGVGNHLPARRLGTGLLLVVAWCALWGQITVANVISGALIAFVVMRSGLGTSVRGRIRPVPLLRFVGVVGADLVRSTISVAAAVLRSDRRTDEAIIAVALPPNTRRHFLLLICAITVTPGTAVVDADPDTGTVYLHLLDAAEIADVTRHVELLARLADEALPVRGSTRPLAKGNPQ